MRIRQFCNFGPLVLLAAALTACTEPTPELPIAGSVELAPVPAEYATYAREVEACSGRKVPDGVTFYVYSGVWFYTPDSLPAVGLYQYTARRITLGTRAAKDPRDVRHELLHAVLPPNYADPSDDAAAHPVEYFGVPGSTDSTQLGKCGAIVSH